jgi:hypothetical protein
MRLKSPAAAGTAKPARPARCGKVLSTSRLVAKTLLELEQGARKVGHHGHQNSCVRDLFYQRSLSTLQDFAFPDAEG